MQRHPWSASVALLTLSLVGWTTSGCGRSDEPGALPQPAADAAVGDFRVEPCVHVAQDVEYDAECGLLIVPENRDDPESRLLALPVKRIPARDGATAEPIFYLTGGPGQSNLGYNRVDWYHDDHDIVLVGYRGVDGSVHLGCPEVGEAMAADRPMMSPEGRQLQIDAFSACAERLESEGIDLDGYTVLEVVDDIEAARRALGYDRIDLESASYGTRLALIYGWRYPDNVDRSAMVAVNPPGRFEWDGAVLEDQIERYAALCARDESCSSRTDDLAGAIRKAIDNFPQRWLLFRVDRDAALFATFMGLYSTSGAAMTFDNWIAASEGDYSGMALITMALPRMIPPDFAWGDSAAKAYSADYDVAPGFDFDAEALPGRHLLGSPGSAMGWASAPHWPSKKIPDEYRTARPSRIRTLMLSGTLDVATPAEHAANQLVPVLANGKQVVLAEFAHTGDLFGLQPEATRHLLTTFFATGEIDASRFERHEIDFEPDWSIPTIAKLLLAGVIVVPVVLVLLVWRVVRFVRRRRTSRGAVKTA